MKKSLFLFPSLLLLAFIFLTLIDCSDYALEKKIWLNQREYDQLSQNPQLMTKDQFYAVINSYKALIRHYPHSHLLVNIYMHMGDIYLAHRDIQLARACYEEILKKKYIPDEYMAEVLVKIALAYKQEGKQDKANLELIQAEIKYKEIILKNKSLSETLTAEGILARCYLAQSQWENAFKVLSSILIKDPPSPLLNNQMKRSMINSIKELCIEKLKNPALFQRFFDELIKKYPNLPRNYFD